MKYKNFEDFLEEVWWKQGHLKDEFPDGFTDWYCNFDADEWFSYAELYAVEKQKETLDSLEQRFRKNKMIKWFT